MKEFPFIESDLLSLDSFISFCDKRKVKVSRDYLELLHKEGLLVPCVRTIPSVDTYLKVRLEGDHDDKFISTKDKSKFAISHIYPQKYYLQGSTAKIAYPIKDEVFIPWKTYKFSVPDFSPDKKIFRNLCRLYYSKKQIYLLKLIEKGRGCNISFYQPLTIKFFHHLQKRIGSQLKNFDKLYKEELYPDYVRFFKFYCELDNIRNKSFDEANSLYADDLQELKKEYLEKTKYLIKNKFTTYKDWEWVADWREKIMNLGAASHEDFNLFKLVESKRLSKSQSQGKIQFILDCFNIAHNIEWVFKIVGFKKFISPEKLHWGVDNVKQCIICESQFIPNKYKPDTETCPNPRCRKALRNSHRNQKRRLERQSKK